MAWSDMNDLQRLAHSLRNNTAYQQSADPGLFDLARLYNIHDSTPNTLDQQLYSTLIRTSLGRSTSRATTCRPRDT